MDGCDAALVARSLGHSQRGLVAPVVLHSWSGSAVAARRQRLEAKVYAKCSIASGVEFKNRTLKADVPTATRILREAAGAKVATIPATARSGIGA